MKKKITNILTTKKITIQQSKNNTCCVFSCSLPLYRPFHYESTGWYDPIEFIIFTLDIRNSTHEVTKLILLGLIRFFIYKLSIQFKLADKGKFTWEKSKCQRKSTQLISYEFRKKKKGKRKASHRCTVLIITAGLVLHGHRQRVRSDCRIELETEHVILLCERLKPMKIKNIGY